MSGHTEGPWHIGHMTGQHLIRGADKCYMCESGYRLIKTTEAETSRPERFTKVVHWHLCTADEAEEDGYPSFRTIVSEDGTDVVGTFDYDEGGVCTNWDDARLIAAAPDLLHACKETLAAITRTIDSYNGDTDIAESHGLDDQVMWLTEAIKKAEGV